MAKKVCMLTTVDNPFNPISQFDEWFLFDVGKGYNSCGLLARIAHTSEQQFTEEENNEEIERAIDEIIEFDPLNIYKKVVGSTIDQEVEPVTQA